MKLHDFINNSEIEMIADNIKNKKEFGYEKRVKGYDFAIHSIKAGCDWNDGTKEGDYAIGVDISDSIGGTGAPYGKRWLEKLSDKQELSNFIDDYLSKFRIEGYQKTGEGQMNLFSLI